MSHQHADLIWRDTPLGQVPIATQFDDPYYSLDNGLAETEHVFIKGNNLPSRFQAPLHIAELGFGTGLNLLTNWDAAMQGPTELGMGVTLEVLAGEVATTLPNWLGKADAWFLDGFSPAKNPAMWTPEIMQAVGDHTVPGGTLATYTAAGHVRRSLESAGFTITRTPGFGRKRHMTRGIKQG